MIDSDLRIHFDYFVCKKEEAFLYQKELLRRKKEIELLQIIYSNISDSFENRMFNIELRISNNGGKPNEIFIQDSLNSKTCLIRYSEAETNFYDVARNYTSKGVFETAEELYKYLIRICSLRR